MKKIYFLAIILALLSCEDKLEIPLQSSISTINFFQSQSDFDLALTGAYDPIASHQPGNGNGTYFRGLMILGRAGTDEMYATQQFQAGFEITDYTFTPANQYTESVWEFQYVGISRANTILNRLPAAIERGVEIPQSEIDRISGEAYFLRGFYYWQLARLYGGVPLVTQEVVDVNTLSLVRNTLAETYAQIIADFEQAEALLPVVNQNGRARKYAATTFLAKAYLQMAGEPLNDATAAAKSLEYTTKVIDEGGFALVPNYQDCFNYRDEYHSEYIFDAEYTFCGNCEGGQVGTWSGAPDFTFTQAYTLVRTFAEHYFSYDENDPRREWNIARYRIIDAQGTREPLEVGDTSYYAYKWRHDTDEDERPEGFFEWQSPFNFPITRYADVLLMHAEALWRQAGSPAGFTDSRALDAINQVRRRAYGVDLGTADPAVDLVSIDEQALLDERKWELCYEGHRWHDLVRFGKLEEAVKSINYEHDPNLPRPDLSWQPHHIFFPIPQTVIDTGGGDLKQNCGYSSDCFNSEQ